MRPFLCALFLLNFLPLTAFGQEITGSTPVFGQKVLFNVPEGWKPAFEQASQEHYISEMVPKDESKENWTQMFTIQGFKGAAQKIPPQGMLAVTVNMHKALCGNQVTVEDLGPGTISGFKTHRALIGCAAIAKDHPSGLKAGMSEIAYYIVVQGKEDVYVFHKAQRGKKYDPENPPLTKANAEEFMEEFRPIRLCEKTGNIGECLQ